MGKAKGLLKNIQQASRVTRQSQATVKAVRLYCMILND
jgi:hypothetical protein